MTNDKLLQTSLESVYRWSENYVGGAWQVSCLHSIVTSLLTEEQMQRRVTDSLAFIRQYERCVNFYNWRNMDALFWALGKKQYVIKLLVHHQHWEPSRSYRWEKWCSRWLRTTRSSRKTCISICTIRLFRLNINKVYPSHIYYIIWYQYKSVMKVFTSNFY